MVPVEAMWEVERVDDRRRENPEEFSMSQSC